MKSYTKMKNPALCRSAICSRIICVVALSLVAASTLAADPAKELAEPVDPLAKPAGRTPLVVLKQAAIQGQVFFITDEADKQVPGKDVSIQINDYETNSRLYKTQTDKDGKYILPNFDVGKYRFLVGRLKLELEVTEELQPGKRIKRISKKIIVFIPEGMR